MCGLGMSRGALYHQFRDKQDVLEAVIGEVSDAITPTIQVHLDQPGFTLLHEEIQKAADEGLLLAAEAEGFTHLLNGALNALATWGSF